MIEIVKKMIFQDIILIIKNDIVSLSIFLIFTAIIVYISEKIELEKFIFEIKDKFFKDYSYKWKVLFFTYLYFILDKTLLDRSLGVKNNIEASIKENWLFFFLEDTWSKVQAIENIIFFIPFSCFLLLGFYNSKERKLKLFKEIGVISFKFSLFIELLQLIFTLGTFQLSDVVYNTLGGVIGAILAISYSYIQSLILRRKK